MRTLDFSAVRTAALAILLALLPVVVNAQTPPPGTPWSMLGIHSTASNDATYDAANAAALNGLPTGQVIIGDCVAGNPYIRISAQWILQDNLTIYVQPGCKVVCVMPSWPNGGQGAGCITQSTISNASILQNVFIDGLYVLNNDSTVFRGKALRFAANHLTMTNVTADGFYAFAYVRGADQEWSGAFINSPSVNDLSNPGDGFRHFGNKIGWTATTGGKPANVWVHNFMTTGQSDGAIQVAPSCVTDNGAPKAWNNDSADDYLYEDSNVIGAPGTMVLVGYPGVIDSSLHCTDATITNIHIRNITGSSSGPGVLVYAAGKSIGQCDSCSIDGVLIENVTIDQTNRPTSTPAGGAFSVRGADLTPITNVTLKSITVTNTDDQCFEVSALPASGIVLDQITCASPRNSGAPNGVIRATTGVTVKNSTIGSNGAAAIEVGPVKGSGNTQTNRVNGGNYNVLNVVLDNNQLTGVKTNKTGVLFRNSENGSMTNSTVTELASPSQTNTSGATFTSFVSNDNPGSLNNSVTGNNLTGVDKGLVCAPNNTASGNTGNAPIVCP